MEPIVATLCAAVGALWIALGRLYYRLNDCLKSEADCGRRFATLEERIKHVERETGTRPVEVKP
jgi:hypothetical protein